MYKLLVLLPSVSGYALSDLHFVTVEARAKAIEWLLDLPRQGEGLLLLAVDDFATATDQPETDAQKIEKRINNLRKTESTIHECLVEGLNEAFGANRVNMYIDRRELVRLMEVVIGRMPVDTPVSIVYPILQEYCKSHAGTVS